jgi:hypothetical protein
MMDELPEFLKRLATEPVEPAEEPLSGPEDEGPEDEMPVEVAREVVEGPSLAEAVESGAPLPVVQGNTEKLGRITGKALDKLAEILGMTREEMLAMKEDEFERSVAWAKLQLAASEVALRTQVRVDENAMKRPQVDLMPMILEKLVEARKEAARLAAPDEDDDCFDTAPGEAASND